jgi:hypothetical protein
MTFVVLVAAIGLVLAGLLAISFGVPIKEFSTGNTLIITGVMGVCTGAIMLALWMVVRELKNVARRLGTGALQARGEAAVRPVLPPGLVRDPAPAEGGFPFGRDQPVAPPAGRAEPPAPPPWQDEAVLRDHPIPEPMFPDDAAAPPPPPPDPKPKRNLLFSSTSRKEREWTQGRTSEPLPPDLLSADLRPKPPVLPPPSDTADAPSFEDTWPRTERSRPDIPLSRRGPRMSSKLSESNVAPARDEDQPAATVLKSGIVDGMAYSLYSDGSIEAQMPEGMMRFGSIDELRAHLDQRS